MWCHQSRHSLNRRFDSRYTYCRQSLQGTQRHVRYWWFQEDAAEGRATRPHLEALCQAHAHSGSDRRPQEEPDRPVINVYIGTPNRVKELALRQAINLGPEQFKFFILDTTQNAKGFTVFETHETRDDTFNLLLYSQKRLFKRKLKLYLV